MPYDDDDSDVVREVKAELGRIAGDARAQINRSLLDHKSYADALFKTSDQRMTKLEGSVALSDGA